MFNIGCELCSCHFLYNLYLKQVVFVQKRKHSVSNSPEHHKLENAKQLHLQEYGTKALPWSAWGPP